MTRGCETTINQVGLLCIGKSFHVEKRLIEPFQGFKIGQTIQNMHLGRDAELKFAPCPVQGFAADS
jgi:hypothetical protein